MAFSSTFRGSQWLNWAFAISPFDDHSVVFIPDHASSWGLSLYTERARSMEPESRINVLMI